MCRAKSEAGGRRCIGHLKMTVAKMEAVQEDEDFRYNVLQNLAKFVANFEGTYTQAVRAFAEKYGTSPEDYPPTPSKLQRMLEGLERSKKKRSESLAMHQANLDAQAAGPVTIQGMVAAEKAGNYAHVVEQPQEPTDEAPVASDSMTIRGREVSLTDEKAGTEALAQVVNDALKSGDYDEQRATNGPRIRMVTLFSSANAEEQAEVDARVTAEEQAEVPEEGADIATITAGEEAELRERIEHALSAAREKFDRADWKRVQNIHTKSAVRERMSELGSTDAYDRELEELENERTRLKAKHEANLKDIESQVRKEHASELASAREAEMNRAEGTISLADAREVLERDRYLGAALRKHVGAERGPVKVNLYQKVKGGEPVRIGSEGAWDVSNGNAEVIADAVNDFTANSLHAIRPGHRRQARILNWTRTKVEDDGSVTIMMAAGVNAYRKERLGENILNSIWTSMNT